jgi:hypothetical protein
MDKNIIILKGIKPFRKRNLTKRWTISKQLRWFLNIDTEQILIEAKEDKLKVITIVKN